MRSLFRRLLLFVPVLCLFVAGVPMAAARAPRSYLATITDTECGPSHARMLATGKMGTTDPECSVACVNRGATYGAIVRVGGRPKFLQLDDQERPAPFAGKRVRIWGRIDGDTLFVDHIEPAR